MQNQRNFSVVVNDCLKATEDSLESCQFVLNEFENLTAHNYGISLFDVRNHDLCAYICELAYLLEKMSHAESINGDQAIERLCFLRTILERIRSMEKRIQPQIDKLFADSVSCTQKSLRPCPQLMKTMGDKTDTDNEDDNEVGDGSDVGPKIGKYNPPKLVAVHYNVDEGKEERRVERMRKRALQSSLIHDLRAEFTETPEEIHERQQRSKFQNDLAERERYEEDYFVRLQVSKKEKNKRKVESRRNALDDLLHFGDYMAFDESKMKKSDKDGKTTKRKASKFSRKGGKRLSKRRPVKKRG